MIMGPSRRSPKITMPKDMPNINRVYLKGVTAEIEPLRIAFINAAYAKTPNTTAATRPVKLAAVGQTNDLPSQKEKSAPATTTVRNPYKPRTQVLIDAGAARLAKSLPANPSVPMTASNDKAEKSAAAGRRMITTPIKPATMEHHRRQPTVSPKNTIAPTTTMMGVA